ncbi:MAG: ABC transporter ATP-binding protein [Steroidobacteraceae bacterium]
MVKMERVSKIYKTNSVETHALRELSIEIGGGEFVAITGTSGSGKSTFLNIAGLLEEHTSGRYELDGTDVSTLGDRQRSLLRNTRIGFIFQSFNLIPDLSIEDNVSVPLRYRRMSMQECRQRTVSALRVVGLSGRAGHLPAQLSGGQQQRAAIARAIAGGPAILFADEPTGNLDSEMAAGVLQLLVDLHRRGTCIVLVTHDQEIAAHAQRRVRIEDGRIIRDEGGI